MKLKKLGMAFVAVLAVTAVMASSALAAATTTDVQVYTGPSPGTILSGTESVTITGSAEIVTTIGETPLKLKSTELECISCTIKNEGGVAVTTGKLLFKNVTFVTPATCAVEGGKIETKLLETKADYMIGTTSYKRAVPEEGEVFATIKVIKGSAACAITGTYNVTGVIFLKGTNETGVSAVSQGFASSGAINAEAGGELKFGAKKAELNGSGSVALSGAKKGTSFTTK